MTTELRALDPADWQTWYRTLTTAFASERETAEERALWNSLTEHKRSLGAWDGGDVVGTLSAFSFRLSVPGGAVVPAAGLTMVGVLPTHRRRGLLTSMIRRHLDEVYEGGEPLAVLTASQPAIYGRFGYGAASWKLRAQIDTSRVRLPGPPGGPDSDGVRLRLVDSRTALKETERVYARQVGRRPGMLERSAGWEELEVLDAGRSADGPVLQHCVLAERDGESVGYARYSVHDEGGPSAYLGTVRVQSLEADDTTVYAALWRFLFSIDLTTRVTCRNRPVDDAWQYLVDDVRECGVRVGDSLYLRPVELGGALAARRYAAPVDVVLEVTDPFCPWNEGRWRLSGDREGAVCVRTGDAADLRLSVREIGGAYLGGTALSALHRAGLVEEVRPGAVAAASTALGADSAPWLPHGF
ncbi:GNAT family N-acetyltransferase [Streptomyces sp. SM14]|uniref:GNAT family N-acetyltransferase n=2 Tax=Streptomyces TaxID=1883 RepID=UPI000CD5B21C|nr:GNAT family N-acetyltransferase [Streptomyces sp. SM14]